jgi:hypothetical protein
MAPRPDSRSLAPMRIDADINFETAWTQGRGMAASATADAWERVIARVLEEKLA